MVENLREAGRRAAIVTTNDNTSRPYTHGEVGVVGEGLLVEDGGEVA